MCSFPQSVLDLATCPVFLCSLLRGCWVLSFVVCAPEYLCRISVSPCYKLYVPSLYVCNTKKINKNTKKSTTYTERLGRRLVIAATAKIYLSPVQRLCGGELFTMQEVYLMYYLLEISSMNNHLNLSNIRLLNVYM